MVEAKPTPARVALGVSTRSVLLCLLGIAVLLGLLSGVGRLLRWYVWPADAIGSRVALMFDVNIEHNIPSFYSSILILSCVPLLLYIHGCWRRREGGYAWHWLGLALIFLALSLDEAIELHGGLNGPVAKHMGAAAPTFGWTMPAIAALAVFGAAYARFLLSLPGRTRIILAASGLLYVAGAVGFELVAGLVVLGHLQTTPNQTYALATLCEHLEELLEMAGVSLFIYGLLRYIRDEMGGVRLLVRFR